jgi:NitT/TauT family transport system substrate-binding protein
MKRAILAAAAAASLAAMSFAAPAAAQDNKIRIVQQFGLSYLPLHMALEHKLVEKHAAAAGVQNPAVEASRLASGAATNDALLSGSVDLAMAGMAVLLNLWDKTVGHAPVRGMMAIADTPTVFNTIDPKIKSIRDLGPEDRIAMTAGRGTQHAIILQMAAAKEFGWENREKLDSLAVSMSHPDGVVGLLSGGVAFKSHITTVPFIQMELADPRVRTVFSSYDVSNGRQTLIVAYAAEKWRKENPRMYAAAYAALKEGMERIKADTMAAAELYMKVEKPKLSVETIHAILKDENMLLFTPAPSKAMFFADFMHKSGLMKNRMASWKDAFFDNVHALPGN